MKYRCIATSPEGFVQQLVSAYLAHGYWFYVSGIIPLGKGSESVDEKLIVKYRIDISRSSRSRRKAAGKANVHYLRYRHRFLLLATHGRHAFFEEEQKNIRDARRYSIRFAGYSISVKRGNYLRRINESGPANRDGKWRVRVQIGRKRYAALKAYFVDIARQRSVDHLAAELYCLPFEPYAPVRQQLLNILRLVNKKRKTAGLEVVSPKVLRYQRRIVRPFEPDWLQCDDDATLARRTEGRGALKCDDLFGPAYCTPDTDRDNRCTDVHSPERPSRSKSRRGREPSVGRP